ncbi:MAG: serine/threonine protein kinase, partial [Deltaproteobacteria bacterium]|nr:serine/threonine protein kinase [Deltaproteobacteria bacterium]
MTDTVATNFVEHRLLGAEKAAVEHHIDHCDHCRRLLVELQRTGPTLAIGSAPTVAAGSAPTAAVGSAPTLAAGYAATLAIGSAPTLAEGDETPVEVAPGTVLGRYIVTKRLGSGGMATVYAAHDPKIDRTVAVKLLHHDANNDPELGARLGREAQALARVDHPNVVKIYDVGSNGDQVFIAMELVQGQTLRDWLTECERSVPAIIEMYLAAARGLAAAHTAGIVHRDFKPENVLVRADGQLKVSDFGLASTEALAPTAPLDGNGSIDEITRTGTILGTPAYMAPEQIMAGAVDARSDQFSFCVALYEALYACRPFSGRSVAELSQQIRSGLQSMPSTKVVPSWLRRLISRGLSVSPAARFPTMQALIAELDRRPVRTRRIVLTATLAVMAAGGGIGFAAWSSHRQQQALVCSGAEDQLAGVWDPARRTEMKAAFVKTNRPYATDTFERVAHQLDTYSSTWAASHKQTCEATRVHKSQSEPVLDLRMSCLADRRRELRAVVGVLAQASERQVRDSLAVVADLEPMARCEDVQQLQVTAPRPADPITRGQIDQLAEQLAEAEASSKATEPAARVARANALVADARAVGYDPVLARALLHSAIALGEFDKRAEADASLREAIWVADRGRDDRTRAFATMELLRRVAKDKTPTREGPLVLNQAEAAVSRLADDDRARAELRQSHAAFLIATGKGREAVPLLREGITLIERDVAGDSLALADASLNLALALAAVGDPAAVIVEFERALAIYVRVLGARHPRVMEVRSELAVELLEQGKWKDVVDLLVPTIAGLEEAYGVEHSQVANARRRLGMALRKVGRLDDGQRELEQALAIHTKVLGEQHPEVATTLDHLGRLALDRKDYARAVERFEAGLRVSEAALGPEHPQVGVLLSSIGNAHRRQGKHAEAITAYEKSMAITEKAFGAKSPAMSEALSM